MLKTILLIDDSKVSRIMLKKILAKIGNFEFFEAENGEEGVVKYWQHLPDITFMDLTMPVMDGFEATRLIKEESPNAIIIVGTADVQPQAIQRVVDIGATSVVKKPFQVDSVAEALTNSGLKF